MRTILLAGGVAMLGTLLGTRFAIRFLVGRGYGQFIRDDGPTSHHTKRGTPTMGGIVIIVSVLGADLIAHLATWTPPAASGLVAPTWLGQLVILDAQAIDKGPIARVKVPFRLRAGLHGNWFDRSALPQG